MGIKRVLLPKHNQPDLGEVPADVREQLTFIGCECIDQVLREALISHPNGRLPQGQGNGQPQQAITPTMRSPS
jgi:ATP-dependent Lon protease